MKPAPRHEIFAWGMYDFANSAFATVVLTAVFPIFFWKVLVGDETRGVALWGYVVSASMLVVAFLAPLIGAISDTSASKKRFLFCLWLPGCVATAFLGFFGEGQWVPAAAVFILANIGFSGGNALYNAFLPELAPRERMDRVSGFGWGIGYLGGGLCLAITLFLIKKWEAVDWSFVVVGAWWFLFSIPFFVMVKERATAVPIQGSRIAFGFRKVFRTLGQIRKYRQLSKFLLAFLLFNDGVQTVIVMATLFGKQLLRMEASELITIVLMIQGVALLGSIAFGFLAHGIGSKRALIVSLFIWCGVLVWGYFLQTKAEFWVLGAVIGTVLGGTQAISRSMMGKFTPPRLTGEFFGFYAISGKFASVLGPLVFGAVTHATGNIRYGVLAVGFFFVAGMLLLFTVNEKKGIEEAEAA